MTSQAPKSVLVVDDSALMRRLITEIVEADPELRVVDVAENGRVALQKARKHRPDCILLDVEMPELSGLDTMRRLRLRSSAKIVILSHLGHEGSRVRAEAFRLGAVDVIDKPTGAVSRDLRNTRGNIIQQTLRRVLGMSAARVPDEPLPAEGGSTTASILCASVRGLGSLRERVEVTALLALLNESLATVFDVAQKHEGHLDAQVGGAMLVAFGVPRPRADHASLAVAAGTELLRLHKERAAERRRIGAPFVEVGVVIATGLVLAGELGPPGARSFRTVGGAMDLAPRLGRSTEHYGAELVVCGRTLGALASSVPTRRLDVVQIDPEAEPVTLYEVLSEGSNGEEAALAAYAQGLEHYEAGQLGKAAKAFEAALTLRPTDRAAARLLARCRGRLRAPSEAWPRGWPSDGGGD